LKVISLTNTKQSKYTKFVRAFNVGRVMMHSTVNIFLPAATNEKRKITANVVSDDDTIVVEMLML
jgi:hypothetical protein